MKENIYPFRGRPEPDPASQSLRKVLSVNDITASTYVLRIERNGMDFKAGQYISAGIPGKNQLREYSIFSPEDADHIEILVKEVEDGTVSRQLHRLREHDQIEVDGPFGFFTLPDDAAERKFLFIASGTGISPFHSLVKSYPGIDYKLIHGVRYGDEAYASDAFDKDRHVLCTSRDDSGDFRGRVTAWLMENPVSPDTLCYLCGNCDMIYDAFDILEAQGLPPSNLHAEVYF
jgi:ferredoxin--NADP+ reductase/benzoate/toluate 1,2-dioxygenase reductase subunit